MILVILFSGRSLPAQPVRVACIGNSVTVGHGLKDPVSESYPSQLQQLLGAGYAVKNFGHSGTTLLKKGHRPYYQTQAFANAIAFRPDIAIVHLGLNDTDPQNWPNYKESFEADYAWLLDTLRKVNPIMQVYVCRLTPIFNEHPRFKSGTRNWYWQIQQLIPGIANANHAGLIDLHEPLCHHPDLFPDNLHPDKEGAAIIAQIVYSFLTKDYGGLKLASLFTSNMVLQRRQPIPVYGTANAGDRIKVRLGHQQQNVIASAYGRWKAVFPPMEKGGPYEIGVSSKATEIVLKNILVGDVWLCSGQSNMDFRTRNAENGLKGLKGSNIDHTIRLLHLKGLAATDQTVWDSATLAGINQLQFFSGTWMHCDSANAADFSAIGYYFGNRIARETGVPIGLIQVTVGGSPIESWIGRYAMEQDAQLVDILTDWRRSDFIMDFCRERAALNLKNAASRKQRHPYEPCYNYEAAIDSLSKFPIKGVIWYQGESNTHNADLYPRLFTTLVKSWRQQWGYNFPFYYVQLSGIDRPSWPSFRFMQQQLWKMVPNSRMAVSMDMGDSLNVHPVKKKEVANRLAALALRYTYHKAIAANGPSPKNIRTRNENLVISFDFAHRLKTGNGQTLTGFEIVSDKGIRSPVTAKIRNNEVWIPLSPDIKAKKLLYAWQPFTRANLVNEAGLPASTFSIPVTNKKNK